MKNKLLILIAFLFSFSVHGQEPIWVGKNYVDNQIDIWSSPTQINSNNWHKWLGASVIIGTSFALDRTVNQHLPAQESLKNITHIGDPITQVAIPAVTWSLGLITDNQRTIHTGYNLGFAVINTATVTFVFKGISGRTRPSNTDNPFQFDPFTDWNSGFFSGHTAGCFAMSAILINEYQDKKWLGLSALGISTLVGVSRITLHEHWLSDVVTGAIIGYAIGDLTYRLNTSKSFKILPSLGHQQQTLSLLYQL